MAKTTQGGGEVTADGTPFLFHGELGTTNLDSLTGVRYGIYRQSKSGNVYSGLNYPLDSAGSLLVLPTLEDSGCTQEYRPYISNALYRRRYYLSTFMWLWSPWCQEYNSEFPPSAAEVRSDLPTGSLVLWPTDTPPAGWLICDGASFNPVTYPRLADIFPDGKLPALPCAGMSPSSPRYITRAL